MLTEILFVVLFFIVGYALGRIGYLYKNLSIELKNTNNKRHLPNKNKLSPKEITIDETKFVTNLETDTFKKGFTSLGKEVKSEDGIAGAVAKLSKMKKE